MMDRYSEQPARNKVVCALSVTVTIFDSSFIVRSAGTHLRYSVGGRVQ